MTLTLVHECCISDKNSGSRTDHLTRERNRDARLACRHTTFLGVAAAEFSNYTQTKLMSGRKRKVVRGYSVEGGMYSADNRQGHFAPSLRRGDDFLRR
jgi:hypothetical protein